jgi:hypothetical protein
MEASAAPPAGWLSVADTSRHITWPEKLAKPDVHHIAFPRASASPSGFDNCADRQLCALPGRRSAHRYRYGDGRTALHRYTCLAPAMSARAVMQTSDHAAVGEGDRGLAYLIWMPLGELGWPCNAAMKNQAVPVMYIGQASQDAPAGQSS